MAHGVVVPQVAQADGAQSTMRGFLAAYLSHECTAAGEQVLAGLEVFERRGRGRERGVPVGIRWRSATAARRRRRRR